MAYWIFRYNPQNYRLADRLADPNPVTAWRVNRFRTQIGPGDTVFVYETGANRAIRATLRVDSVPRQMPELESELPYCRSQESQVCWRVMATIVHRDVNLSHRDLRSTPGLENLSVFHGFQQATDFPVTPEQGAILERLIAGSPGLHT